MLMLSTMVQRAETSADIGKRLGLGRSGTRKASRCSMFSKDELDIIRGVFMGWSKAEMSRRFGWPEPMLAQRVDQLLLKLKLTSMVELAFYACTKEGEAALRQFAA